MMIDILKNKSILQYRPLPFYACLVWYTYVAFAVRFSTGLNKQLLPMDEISDPINGHIPKLNKLFSMVIQWENTLSPKK